ncbi:hypothetical protein KEM54_006835 [Ascosphaera aggregata]|nr:hypothetical protein KEM54_006835 [Ascosphaera aggregata]
MFRGERFTVEISDDEDHLPGNGPAVTPGSNFVNDVKERDVAAAAPPPPAPTLSKPSTTGFPEHKKKTRPSAFKQQRGAVDKSHGTPLQPSQVVPPVPGQVMNKQALQEEKQQIDLENKRRLAAMSDSQIVSEREELMSSLPPSLLERFLRRARIDDTPEEDIKAQARPDPIQASSEESRFAAGTTTGNDGFTEPKQSAFCADSLEREINETSTTQGNHMMDIDDIPPNLPDSEIHLPSEFPLPPIHFPTPPNNMTAPNLDPDSPTFLEDLQKHYFPDMPVDPSSLSWLLPSTSPYSDAVTDESSAYHPKSQAVSVSPSGIRFSMTGAILAPKTSLSLPTTLGLHHHASDPEAAGYTIPELSILSRSTVPAQRCIAWCILGRILFRLGKGEFGEPGSPLVEGLWSTVEQENAIAGMLAEAGGGENYKDEQSSRDLTPEQKAARLGKHASAKAYATEALWLWRRGGNGDRGLAKESVSPAK